MSLCLNQMDGAIMKAGEKGDWEMLECLRLMCIARIIEIDNRLKEKGVC